MYAEEVCDLPLFCDEREDSLDHSVLDSDWGDDVTAKQLQTHVPVPIHRESHSNPCPHHTDISSTTKHHLGNCVCRLYY